MTIEKVFAVIIVLGCGVMLLKKLYELKLAFTSKNWIKVPRTIDDAYLEERDDPDYYLYQVHILYHYKVGGQVYHGTRRNFNNESELNLDKAQAILAQYEHLITKQKLSNSSHTIHKTTNNSYAFYNPNNPEQSTLEKGVTLDLFLSILLYSSIIGIVMLLGFD